MLKNAHINTQPDMDYLRNDQFALILMESGEKPKRMFPIFNKQAAEQSAYDFCGGYIYMGPEEQKTAAYHIGAALLTYGSPVSPLIQKLAKEVNSNLVQNESVEAPAPQKKVFALPEYRKYPLDTVEDVKAATDYFGKYASKMEHEYRPVYARNVMERAKELNLNVTDEIVKYAMPVYRDGSIIAQHLKMRMQLVPETREPLTKLASIASQINPLDFSRVLEDVDYKYGLNNQWEKLIPTPDETVLESGGEIRKLAAAGKGWSFSANGRSYSESDLRRACGSEMVKTMYGADMAQQMANPSVFDSLPNPTKATVLSYA